ncbi:MAG: [LysW]-lysine hydrolase [Chloroflexi bacterium]|nr:[LysW]-lysine hydrolase [Chloroflexota bacterium]
MKTASNLKTLVDLLGHYSPSGQEKTAVDFLVSRMNHLGYDITYVDEVGNAIGITGDGPNELILLGHIDTVPGEIPVKLDDDGVIHGRGAVDAKGSLAAFVDAVGALGGIPGWKLIVIGAVDEERDSLGARHVRNLFDPGLAIIGEPSRWDRITLGYKGSARLEITVSNASMHSAIVQETTSERAFNIWSMIKQWDEEQNIQEEKFFNQLNVSLQGIESGNNGLEEWTTMQIGARLPLGSSPKAYYQQISNLISPEQVIPLGYAIPAYKANKNNPLVRAFLRGIRDVGGKPRFVTKTGTADMCIVAPVWKCPVIAYGPGDAKLDHTPHERISAEEYLKAVAVLRAAITNLCSL